MELESCLGLAEAPAVPERSAYSKPCDVDSTALLFPHCPAVLMALHLVYEVGVGDSVGGCDSVGDSVGDSG